MERYAFMTVALSQLFVDRLQILAEAGLDIAAWARIRLGWKAKLPADAKLARRYKDATSRWGRGDGGVLVPS